MQEKPIWMSGDSSVKIPYIGAHITSSTRTPLFICVNIISKAWHHIAYSSWLLLGSVMGAGTTGFIMSL